MEDVSAWGFAILRKSLSFNKYKRRGGMAMKIKKIYKSFSLALLMLALLLIWDVKVEAKGEKNENDVVAIKEIIKKVYLKSDIYLCISEMKLIDCNI